jgi:hypothetical protein
MSSSPFFYVSIVPKARRGREGVARKTGQLSQSNNKQFQLWKLEIHRSRPFPARLRLANGSSRIGAMR